MPSKDILSIRQFQLTQQQSQTEMYPRAYALPQFFTTNLVHDKRIVKAFMGQNAVIKAFYFNYMKLVFQSENSQEYLQIMKEQFLSYDNLKQGDLQDEFLSDFQYRKFFKDFIEIVKQSFEPNFEVLAGKYPIIDQVLEKLFKTVISIQLLQQINISVQLSEFNLANQIIKYLCNKFEEQYSILIPGQCFKFQSTEMYLYFQNMNEVYITYINESEHLEKNTNNCQSSQGSSFVCGQGNSFISKFQGSSQNQTKKHPFRQIDLQTLQSVKKQIQQKKTQSIYLKQNQLAKKLSGFSKTAYDNHSKTQVLQSKGSLIRRRSKNQDLNKQNHKSLIEKGNSFIQLQKQSSFGQSQQQKEEENIQKEKDLTNTLINILNIDTHGSIAEEDTIPFISPFIQKIPQKYQLIMRRKSNKPSNDSTKDLSLMSENNKNNISEQPIILPEPKQQIKIKFVSSLSSYSLKSPQIQMDQIVQLGEDQDQQEVIRDFSDNSEIQMSVKTINLTDSIARKLNIQKIQSRNINISRTSIAEQIQESPNKEPLSFIGCQMQSKGNSKIFEYKIQNPDVVTKVEKDKKSFQNYMKQMRAKLQMRQNSSFQKSEKMDFIFKKNISNLNKNEEGRTIQRYIDDQNIEYNDYFGQEFRKNENIKNFLNQRVNWNASGSDEFTKSNILLLLDEQYRQKIRAIKNEHKSTIKENKISFQKQNFKEPAISDQKFRLRQPSIHVHQE